MTPIALTINGKELRVYAEKIGATLWVHHGGRTFVFEPPEKNRRRAGAGASAATGAIQAPMPGKITKIQASAGQRIQAGTVIVIMEAMKMEYSLEAAVSGVVKDIRCREGDQVSLGQILAIVEENA